MTPTSDIFLTLSPAVFVSMWGNFTKSRPTASMWENVTKLLLWLFTTHIVAEVVHLENSCPEYAPYYCACNWTDIVEVKQLKMCLSENHGKYDCHPCPERLQENVNCDSCDDYMCPICSPLNFDGGNPSSSPFKQPLFFRFSRHGGILHARPFSFQNYHGYHGSDLENAEYHTADDLNDSNTQTVMSNDIFSRIQDSSKRYSQVQIKANMPANTENKSSNPKERRIKWPKFPKQENSRMHHKRTHHSKLMDDNDFEAKSFSVFEERKNYEPFELPLENFYIPELSLFEKRNGYANLNDPNYLESHIEKPKFNRGRKHTGKNKKINLLHKLPSDKTKHASFERLIDNELGNLVKKLKNDKLILLLRPLDILENGDHIHQNIPGEFKTHGVDKYYIQNLPDGLGNVECTFTNESSKIYFNDYVVHLSDIEEIEDIQKCISDQYVYDDHGKLQPFETSCNISLSQTLLFKCMGSEVGTEPHLRNIEVRETVKVYDSNFTGNIERVIEIANLSLEHLSDSDKSTVYDKITDDISKGKVKVNIKIRFSLKKSSDNILSNLPDQEVFRQHDLSEDDDIKIEPYFIDNKLKDNPRYEKWMEKAYLEEAMDDIKPSFSDSEAKKNDMSINTINQEYTKTKFLDFQDSLSLDNKAKSNKLHVFHIKFDDETGNTDWQENWREKVYDKPKTMDKETESEIVFENSVDEFEQPFDKIRELLFMFGLPDTTKITNSPNSGSNFPLKRVFRDIPHSLSTRSSKDPKNSDKIVMTHQSVVQLFSLEQGPVKSQDSSSALWFRYRKNVLMPNINETVHKKNLKNSDIFKLLNVSISSVKESKMYKPDCETCSVIYKTMLDSGFKNDPRLMESVNSSAVVLMNKPQFVSYPHKSKVRTGNQYKNKKSAKNIDSFTIQMNIDFLFLSSGDYKNLSQTKSTAKNNPLRNSPWADMKRNFVFKIPERFSSQSKILELSRSLKHKNMRPVLAEFLNQGEFSKELQKILFALLSKMHETKTKTSKRNFRSTSLVLPTISAEMTKFNEIEKYVNVETGKRLLKVNLKDESTPSPVPTVQDHEESTNKIASNDASQQLKNGTVQTNIKKTENIKEWKQREGNKTKITLIQKTGDMKQPENVTDGDRKYEKNGNSNNMETTEQQISSLKNKDLEINGLRKMFSSENASIENPVKFKTYTHYVSETLKHENEKLAANIGQEQPIKTMNDVFTLKTTLSQIGNGLRKLGFDTENSLKEFGGISSLQKSAGIIRFAVAEDENLHHHREKRQSDSLVAIPHNNWCPVRSMRRNGHLDCTMWTFKKRCTINCFAGYSFNGKANVEMSCSRRQNKWTNDVNNACTASGREGPAPERPERPDRGPAPRPAAAKPSPGGGKLEKVPPKGSAVPSGNAEESEDYYDEYDYQNK